VTTIAVVGLGAMGSRIARRFLDAGNEVVVWNRDASRIRPLIQAGAAQAESPALAAQGTEVVFTMVSNPEALQAVTEGSEGVAAGVGADTTVIQMSTVGLGAVARLTSALPEGTSLLDAPVLGSVSEVEAGTLKVFVGGPESLVERWTPLLSTLGTILHVGEVGAGSAAKLVANATLIGTIGLLGESLALADAVGLPRAAAFDVLATTALAGQAERRRPAIESGNFPPRFALSLARKDADLILAASSADVRILRAARTWLAEAEASGLGADDYSAVLTTILAKA
jgi:3-hydroxyisobutyrate dehydrogenase-like beta-hydroxyacid dehydrogenase